MPPAKLAVVTMPIAASAPMILRRAMRPMSTPEMMPQMPAPTKKLIDITADAAAPPNTACDKPCPIYDMPRKTTNTPSTPHNAPANVAATMPR